MAAYRKNGKLVAQILRAMALNYRLMLCLPQEVYRTGQLRQHAKRCLETARWNLQHGSPLCPSPNALLSWSHLLRDRVREVDKQPPTPQTRRLMLLALNRAYQLEKMGYALFSQM